VPALRRDRRQVVGRKGIVIGVGLPMVSVNRPIMLWNVAVVRRPPFHQPE
jgi:hypothetical protein